MSRALMIVDVQNDFVTGSLAVPGAASVIQRINDLTRSGKYDLVVACKDYHPKNHISFASNHAGRRPFDKYTLVNSQGSRFETTLWPDHCVQGTLGCEFSNLLNTAGIDQVVYKGTLPKAEFYSAVSDVFNENPTRLLELLRQRGITEVDVVGLALDFCVKYTALDIHKHGFETVVKLDCTRAITKEGAHDAIAVLEAAGVSCR